MSLLFLFGASTKSVPSTLQTKQKWKLHSQEAAIEIDNA